MGWGYCHREHSQREHCNVLKVGTVSILFSVLFWHTKDLECGFENRQKLSKRRIHGMTLHATILILPQTTNILFNIYGQWSKFCVQPLRVSLNGKVWFILYNNPHLSPM